jgi:hypothetical protein
MAINDHQLIAGGLEIGGLDPRLKEKAAESQWVGPRAEPCGRAKDALWNQSEHWP